MAKKVSIIDIANSLGVSKTLISLVINNKANEYGISNETQKKVLDKISELGYRPNNLARGFRTGKSNTIGIIVSDISNRFYSRIVRAIEDKAWDKGYSVVICSTNEDYNKEREQIKFLCDKQVDGIIISSSQKDDSQFQELNQLKIPHVLIDRKFDNSNSYSVTIDNYKGSELAINYLINMGYNRIGLITITPLHISTIRDRELGFCDTMKEHGKIIDQSWILKIPFNNLEESIEHKITKLYKSNNLPEVFFTLNNNLTSNTLLTLKKLKIDVPDQISIIGFDDLLYFNFTQPSITAINQPVMDIGEKSFNLLIEQIEHKNKKLPIKSYQLPVELIVRESTKNIKL